jgi:hypothetical protein
MAILVAFCGLATACQAHVMGNLAEVAIIDRDSGAELRPYFYNGEYWVAGRPGARYSIEVRNLLGERLLAVTAVDGVNVLSGATAGWDQTGYVFDSGERYQITGWRKSDAEVAAFTFTDAANSYAERTGRPENVGVIGVALFRERQAPAAYVPQVTPNAMSAGKPADADRALQTAPSAAASALAASAASIGTRGSAKREAPTDLPAPKLGTGHGEREYSYVNRTDFTRRQSRPNEIIRIRYDSMDNLLARGIVKRMRPVSPEANPFPASPDEPYVPDPPG